MLTVEIKHELDDGLSSDSIEATGGLIGQQQGWCRDKSARQCDALLFTTGSIIWIVLQALLQAHAFQHGLCLLSVMRICAQL